MINPEIKLNPIIDVLMVRDRYSLTDAEDYLDRLREQVEDGADPAEIIATLRMEPEYLDYLINGYP